MKSTILRDLVEVGMEEIIDPIKNHVLEPEDAQFTSDIYWEAVDLAMMLLKAYQNQVANIEEGVQANEIVGLYWSQIATISTIKMIMSNLGYNRFSIIITNKQIQEGINLVRTKASLS